MGQIIDNELLRAMKASLLDLDNLKMLSPNDLEIFDMRRNLRGRIAAMELALHEQSSSAGCEIAT